MLPAPRDRVVLLPLGGVGVIGMNCMVFGYGEDLVLLDCGVLFADDRHPGADLLVPSLSVLDRLKGRLRCIILTHGHEDHIGAVPWVAARYDLPVYGTAFTIALVESKAQGRGAPALDLRTVAPGGELRVGAMRFGFLRVTHSIPDCVSLAIRTPAGNVVFTGDWKLDDGLPCGTRFDRKGFEDFGREGVLAMLSDSTNAEVPGFSRGENEVAAGLRDAIAACSGRVFVGLFASNLYRVDAVMRAAHAAGRVVILAGRSLHRYLDAGKVWGGLAFDAAKVVKAEHIDRYEDNEVCVICTGSQGEARATLARMAEGDHQHLRARKGDTLLLSSRKIPGNERAIYAMMDALARRGMAVVHRDDDFAIHASGHAAAGELAWLLGLVRPRFFLPVHGVYPFMLRHAELAAEQGAAVPLIPTNGDVVTLGPDGPRRDGVIEVEPWLVDRDRVGTAANLGVSARRDLALHGTVAVSVVVAAGQVQVRAQSMGLWTDGGRLDAELQSELQPWLTRLLKQGLGDANVEDEIETYARRFYAKAMDRKPLVIAHLMRVPA